MKKALTVLLACFFIAGVVTSAHATILYSENFETNNGGYTHGGTRDEWEWGATNVGHTAWGTDIDGSYSNYSSQWLRSISIDLSSANLSQPLSLSFDYYAQYEHYYDSIHFAYSFDGGSNWTNYYGNAYGSTPWTTYSQDLTGLVNSTLDLKWALYSDVSIVRNGLYIDDVNVDGTPNNTNAIPEPTSLLLFGSGLVGAFLKRRRKV